MSAPNKSYDPVMVSTLEPPAIELAVSQALAACHQAHNMAEFEQARSWHTGQRSPLLLARAEIAALPPAARAEAGKRVSAALAQVNEAFAQRESLIHIAHERQVLQAETVDVTLPWDRHPIGARHPLSAIRDRVGDVFVAMGWEIAEGPEVEASWLNFDALNIGSDHPARTESDTLYVDPPQAGLVLRTHTSPVQIRALLDRPLPVYVVCPGRTYRADELDATHTPVFSQVEGLAVDEGLSMGHLKGTLDAFAAAMFGAGLRTRLRPSYFPFTEPSAEVDLQCFACRGRSVGDSTNPCRTCSSEGWIEWGGCGMVNPRVLVAAGVDPQRYSGFAFGMGLERTVMFRHALTDMRLFIDGDVRFAQAMREQV